MKNLSPFCTCADRECPLHPTNHEKGCAPCIAKKSGAGGDTLVFFNIADPDGERSTYYFEDFAECVFRKQKEAGK